MQVRGLGRAATDHQFTNVSVLAQLDLIVPVD